MVNIMKHEKIVVIFTAVLLGGCAMKSPVTESPRYAGARAASVDSTGWYATIRGGGDSAGCGVGTSEAPVHGELRISVKTEECDLEYRQ